MSRLKPCRRSTAVERRPAGEIGKPVRPVAAGLAGSQDRMLGALVESTRRRASGASCDRQGRPLLESVAAQPLGCRRAADALCLGCARDRVAAGRHPGDQQLATGDCQLGSSMCHESLLSVRMIDNPHGAARLSDVNTVSGHYS